MSDNNTSPTSPSTKEESNSEAKKRSHESVEDNVKRQKTEGKLAWHFFVFNYSGDSFFVTELL